MIRLYGFAVSNYYNKTKLILLEKDLPFEEVETLPSQDPALLARSPLGKIPFIETEHGCLSESQAILEYLEDAYPEKPLYPREVFLRAKTRELIQHIELNVELVARRLYKEAFFGGTVSDETKNEVKERVTVGVQGLARLGRFAPYLQGDTLTVADLLLWVHAGLVGLASEKIYGENLLTTHLPPLPDFLALLETRPSVQKVAADRAAAMAAFFNKP